MILLRWKVCDKNVICFCYLFGELKENESFFFYNKCIELKEWIYMNILEVINIYKSYGNKFNK